MALNSSRDASNGSKHFPNKRDSLKVSKILGGVRGKW